MDEPGFRVEFPSKAASLLNSCRPGTTFRTTSSNKLFHSRKPRRDGSPLFASHPVCKWPSCCVCDRRFASFGASRVSEEPSILFRRHRRCLHFSSLREPPTPSGVSPVLSSPADSPPSPGPLLTHFLLLLHCTHAPPLFLRRCITRLSHPRIKREERLCFCCLNPACDGAQGYLKWSVKTCSKVVYSTPQDSDGCLV